MRAGRTLVGCGMATAAYPDNSKGAKLGPRSTLMARWSCEAGHITWAPGPTRSCRRSPDTLGLPVAHSLRAWRYPLPETPMSGGLQTVAGIGRPSTRRRRPSGISLSRRRWANAGSPLHGMTANAANAQDGWVMAKSDPKRRDAGLRYRVRRIACRSGPGHDPSAAQRRCL